MASFEQPTKQISQTLIWTALPQGPGPSTGTMRISVLVSPQLSFDEVVGYRAEQSTTLQSFPDFLNWPLTVSNPSSPISFEVVFGLPGGASARVHAEADLSVLRADCWAAMFAPATTRVDSYGFTDWSQKSQNTFDIAQAHSDVVGLYNDYSGNSAYVNATASADATSYQDPSQLDLPSVAAPGQLKSSSVPANGAAYGVLAPTPAVQGALDFHAAPANNSSIAAPSVPVLDFHAGISSLGHHPDLLRFFGLCFPLVVSLPAEVAAASSFTLSVVPSWARATPPADVLGAVAPLVPSTDVPLATATLAGSLIPAPADPRLYVGGSLNLQLPQFSVLDVDVDRAAHSLQAYGKNLQSTQALHEPPAGTTLTCKLPALRNAGLSLAWSGWGGAGEGLNALAARQSSLDAAVSSWLATDPGSRPAVPDYVLRTEDVTRGWRLDVEQAGAWKSLHWRSVAYRFGPAGSDQPEIVLSTPSEGIVAPAASHAVTSDGSIPGTIDVHEVIARWVGWSLAAPRPGGQVNDDGSTSTSPLGNPAVPTSYTDGSGNVNPQLSSYATSPPSGSQVDDPVSGELIGTTGLPTLRFGETYRLAARAVDLAGWSIRPGSSEAITLSAPITHSRWDPVRAPIVVPTAPLGPGEGTLTVAIRMDEPGTPAAPTGRLLFPPKVHELLAEEHGAFDRLHTTAPAASSYATIAALADGSPETLPGATVDSSAGADNVVVTVPIPAELSNDSYGGRQPPLPVAGWLADPASYGYALYFEPPPGYTPPQALLQNQIVQHLPNGPTIGKGPSPELVSLRAAVVSSVFSGDLPFTSFVQDTTDRPGIPAVSPVFTDVWSGTWPKLSAKLVLLAPILPGQSVQNPGGGAQLPGGVARPGLLALGNKLTDNPDVVAIGMEPGAVYQVRLSSVIPSAYAVDAATRNVLGLLPFTLSKLQGVVAKVAELYAFLLGQIPQLTPYHTMQLVYAVRIPLLAPSFSSQVSFVRAPNDVTVTIADPEYSLDIPTTATVTYQASWTDPVDDPSDAANDPASDTQSVLQSGLVLSVGNIYAAPIAADPIVPAAPPPSSIPFGTVVPDQSTGADGHTGTLVAVHRIGDTKHHLVTYTPTAATRFAPFFASTVQVTLVGTAPHTLDPRGIDVNTVRVKVASTGKPVAADQYSLNGPAGTIALLPFRLGLTDSGPPSPPGPPVAPPPRSGLEPALSGVELSISYVPTDTIEGAPFSLHIPSTAPPPAVKVLKVAPSWKIETSGSADHAGGYSYRRTGNTLRVYLDRPWWVTGADEMLAVLVPQYPSGQVLDPAVLATVGADQVSLLALDPLSVGAPGFAYSQTQLEFVTPAAVPSTGGALTDSYALVGGNPVKVPSPIDPEASLFQLYAYEPSFDPDSDSWFADVQLGLSGYVDEPPPGYFVRLVLARFQPYSISYRPPDVGGVSQATYLSATTLVTYAQPVPDRSVTVVVGQTGTVDVTVTGPAYQGWRPAPFSASQTGAITPDATEPWDHDSYNNYAAHPNSDGKGNLSTSTMVVELQRYDDSKGFSGDFGWTTIPGGVTMLAQQLNESPIATWTTTADAVVQLPPFVALSQLRLRISELDYFPFRDAPAPATVDTSFRRPFVATIPL